MNDFFYVFVGYLTLTPLILWKLNFDYRRLGRLTTLGGILHVLVYVIHGMFMGFCLWGGWSAKLVGWNFQTYLGLFISIGGLLITIAGMDFFRSMKKHTGLEAGRLDKHGLYAYSRNPQFVGYGLLLGGLSIIWYNQWVWAGLASYYLLIYVIALIEEEHLIRVFGDAYIQYCKDVPRFIRLRVKL